MPKGRPKGGKNKIGHKAGRPRKHPRLIQPPTPPDSEEPAPLEHVHNSSPLNTLCRLVGRLAEVPPENTSEKALVDNPVWMEHVQRWQADNAEGEPQTDGYLDSDDEGSERDKDLVGLGTLMRELEQEGTEGKGSDQEFVGLGTFMRELEQKGTDDEGSDQDLVGLGTLMRELEQEGTDELDEPTVDQGCWTSEVDPASYFSSLQKRLRKEKTPKEYCDGTFWVTPIHPLSEHTHFSTLQLPRVFLWLPHLLVSEPIKCSCGSRLESKGYNKDPHARRIVDVVGCFYLMTMRYMCKYCSKSLNGTDKRILDQLPLHLQEAFPAYLTHRGGVSKALGDPERPSVRTRKRKTKGDEHITELAPTLNVEVQEEGQPPPFYGIVAMNSI